MARNVPRVEDAMRTLLAAVRAGDIDAVSGLLTMWCEEDRVDEYPALVTALIAESGRHLATPDHDSVVILDIATDGEPIDIDAVDPPIRAALRAQLAWLNDSPDDVELQIRMVAESGDPEDRMAMLVNTLMWAV